MSFTIKAFVWVLVSVGAVSGYLLLSETNQTTAPEYILGKVKQGSIEVSILATGKLSPLITVQVGSQASGTIQYLNADFNDQVKKGDVIAQIEPSLFNAKVAQAKANLSSAEAARDKANVSLRNALRKLKRKKHLRKQNMVSESELESALFVHEEAEVEHKVQLAMIAEAEAELQQAQVNLTHSTIYAPINGIVISRNVDVGQTVAASLQAPTLFTIAKDLAKMQIETEVDESYIGMVTEGLHVDFTVYAYPSSIFKGKIAQIRLNPSIEKDVVQYNCIIHVDNHDLRLKPGMTAAVTIKTRQKENILKVPNAGLRYIPEMPAEQLKQLRNKLKLRRDQGLLWTLTEGVPKPVKVTIGLTGEKETEISGENLHKGLTIITREKKDKKPEKRSMGLRLF